MRLVRKLGKESRQELMNERIWGDLKCGAEARFS